MHYNSHKHLVEYYISKLGFTFSIKVLSIHETHAYSFENIISMFNKTFEARFIFESNSSFIKATPRISGHRKVDKRMQAGG